MKVQESIHANSIRQLLVTVSAICLLGFTGCNSIDAGAGKGFRNAYLGTTDTQPIEDVVAANRDWYQLSD